MYIENLTFNHAIELFKYLEKNKLECHSITISFYDRSKYQYITFKDTKELRKYFAVAFINFPKCKLGNFVSIEKFKINSTLYNFKSNYIVYDVLKSVKIITGKDSDINRNINRDPFITKQKILIEEALKKYIAAIIKLNLIYKGGIYSPCYAEPGWSKGTSIWP